MEYSYYSLPIEGYDTTQNRNGNYLFANVYHFKCLNLFFQADSSDQDEGQGDAKDKQMLRRRRFRGPFSTVYVGNLPRKLRISDFKSKARSYFKKENTIISFNFQN